MTTISKPSDFFNSNDLEIISSNRSIPVAYHPVICNAYISGISSNQISKFIGKDKSTVVKILREKGVEIRSCKDRQKLFNSRLTATERKTRVKAANDAWKSREWTNKDGVRFAIRKFITGGIKGSKFEDQFIYHLNQQGVKFIRNFPFGIYNIDFIVNGCFIEINGGGYHFSEPQLSKDLTKYKLILDSGFDLVIYGIRGNCGRKPVIEGSIVEDIVRWTEIKSLNESPFREYRVISGDFQGYTVRKHKFNSLPTIPMSVNDFRKYS